MLNNTKLVNYSFNSSIHSFNSSIHNYHSNDSIHNYHSNEVHMNELMPLVNYKMHGPETENITATEVYNFAHYNLTN